MNITVKIDDGGLQKKLTNARGRTLQEIKQVNTNWAFKLHDSLVQHASGRPGPQVITGAYIRAMRVEVVGNGLKIGATNDSPQAERLEHGFVGRDSLGRYYHQPPFPHFLPAFTEVYPGWVQALKDVPRRLFL